MNSIIWQVAKALWPLWAILGFILIVRLTFDWLLPTLIDRWKLRRKFAAGRKWRSGRELVWMLRGMKSGEFEEYIANLFAKLGYKTEKVGGAYDKGIDVVAEKDGVKHYIQCKKYSDSSVGVDEVREFYGAIADQLANGTAYFITTNKFTPEAERFAADKPIELIDQLKLVEWISEAEKRESKNVENAK